jgi:hypothetical protein
MSSGFGAGLSNREDFSIIMCIDVSRAPECHIFYGSGFHLFVRRALGYHAGPLGPRVLSMKKRLADLSM